MLEKKPRLLKVSLVSFTGLLSAFWIVFYQPKILPFLDVGTLTRAFSDIVPDEYGSSANAVDWVGDNLERSQLGELSDETLIVCKLLRSKYEAHYYREACRKLFPEI